jgi:lysophospholipase L1-like esterase
MAVVMALVVAVYLTGRSYDAPPASAASGTTTTTVAGATTTTAPGTTTTAGPSFSAFYLDVGASASLGFQPTGIVHHNGRRTNTGYANDLLEVENIAGVSLTLDQIGCPAETVQSILNPTVADHCYKLPETQMTQAVKYLQENQGTPGLVTIDLGFNNIRVCLSPVEVNEPCVAAAVAAVQVDMPKVIKDLKAAAGSNVRFVGLEYNDPFLSHFLDGSSGPDDATATLVAMDRLNAALGQAFKSNGVAIANVPAIFETDNTTRVTVPNVGIVPENVEEACMLTWMCYTAPFGPDDHPNDAGYALIAQAIAAELPKSW